MKPTFAYAPKAFAFFQTTMFSMFFKAIVFSYWNRLSTNKDFRCLGLRCTLGRHIPSFLVYLTAKSDTKKVSAPESTIQKFLGCSRSVQSQNTNKSHNLEIHNLCT